MGTDRISTDFASVFQLLTGVPFDKSDELWTSFQQKVSKFINDNGGSANAGNQIKERPDYQALKDYFDGKITLQQLKDRKGCS